MIFSEDVPVAENQFPSPSDTRSLAVSPHGRPRFHAAARSEPSDAAVSRELVRALGGRSSAAANTSGAKGGPCRRTGVSGITTPVAQEGQVTAVQAVLDYKTEYSRRYDSTRTSLGAKLKKEEMTVTRAKGTGPDRQRDGNGTTRRMSYNAATAKRFAVKGRSGRKRAQAPLQTAIKPGQPTATLLTCCPTETCTIGPRTPVGPRVRC